MTARCHRRDGCRNVSEPRLICFDCFSVSQSLALPTVRTTLVALYVFDSSERTSSTDWESDWLHYTSGFQTCLASTPLPDTPDSTHQIVSRDSKTWFGCLTKETYKMCRPGVLAGQVWEPLHCTIHIKSDSLQSFVQESDYTGFTVCFFDSLKSTSSSESDWESD